MLKCISKKLNKSSCPLILLSHRLRMSNLLENLIFFFSFLIIFGAIIYYFYALNYLGVFLSLILSIICLIKFKNYLKLNLDSIKITLGSNYFKSNDTADDYILKKSFIRKALIITYFVLLSILVLILISNRTDEAIISPWNVLPKYFFVLYFLNTLILLLISNKLKIKQTNILISLHYFLSLSVATIIYKISYGFDPFIHQASLEVINKIGYIQPKTPYYLGFYSLITSLNKIFGLSLAFLNKYLLLILASLILPISLSSLINNITLKTKISEISLNQAKLINNLTLIFLLSLSLPLFIINTPQNLSYLFLTLSIVFGLQKNIPASIVFTLSTLAIHPISGIPAIILLFLIIIINKIKNRYLKYLTYLLGFIAGVFTIPVLLNKLNYLKLNDLFKNFVKLKEVNLEYLFYGAGQENWFLNFTYFIYLNRFLILLILVIIGVYFFKKYILSKHYSKDESNNYFNLLILACALLLASLLSSLINFKEIIAYEQGGYAIRLLTISLLLLSPFFIFISHKLIILLSNKNYKIRFSFLILFALTITSLFYLSYPRFDNYHNSRGYSTSQLDFEAVKLIESIEQEPYFVLANQQVSAAAVKILGFKQYFPTPETDVFFYPIPTGGPLYDYYLKMVYEEPSKKTIRQAMDWLDVNKAYFIVNKYWHASDVIIESAKLSADSWTSLGISDLYIFSYQK